MTYSLDKTDKSILRILQTHGKINTIELAEQVGLSVTPCARRLKLLASNGYIETTIAVLNPEKLGLDLTVYIAISMERHTPEQFDVFEAAVKTFPEVVSCSVVTGRVEDYLLRVVVRDMKHYEEFLLGRLNRIKGVDTVHSSFELRRVIRHGALPIY
ncbi:Lrp/AsnC family transcriptional regulator [Ostreibacterium oceani]|uniref:Winged helix-turn-helix transcriptional regulator n=1 Tax=Ostreibacterium oceani TaxID=2654998 RepID=A0A6N7EXF1_9GAMM|nr:Lrp/AsnC family transcriptional regulator [Ostreibacterium oceani]MPV85148.1 winged helix-turn-helix transcriptional regulator [Ostreibacterium oceani]